MKKFHLYSQISICFFALLLLSGCFDSNQLGITKEAPLGSYEKLNKRLTQGRLVKADPEKIDDCTAYFYEDRKSVGRLSNFLEYVMVLVDDNDQVVAVGGRIRSPKLDMYKTSIALFFIKYWKKFTNDKKPEWVTGRGHNAGDTSKFSNADIDGLWYKNDKADISYLVFNLKKTGPPSYDFAKKIPIPKAPPTTQPKKEEPKTAEKKPEKKPEKAAQPKKEEKPAATPVLEEPKSEIEQMQEEIAAKKQEYKEIKKELKPYTKALKSIDKNPEKIDIDPDLQQQIAKYKDQKSDLYKKKTELSDELSSKKKELKRTADRLKFGRKKGKKTGWYYVSNPGTKYSMSSLSSRNKKKRIKYVYTKTKDTKTTQAEKECEKLEEEIESLKKQYQIIDKKCDVLVARYKKKIEVKVEEYETKMKGNKAAREVLEVKIKKAELDQAKATK